MSPSIECSTVKWVRSPLNSGVAAAGAVTALAVCPLHQQHIDFCEEDKDGILESLKIVVMARLKKVELDLLKINLFDKLKYCVRPILHLYVLAFQK